ncbi:MAG: class I SAM-dependent methyltransferase [Bacteroidetes bacterium]|nr:class I SAM-dependent methyltransferase [Bacteroidota bacterium]
MMTKEDQDFYDNVMNNVQGAVEEDEYQELFRISENCKYIIEIGAWHGKSTILLAYNAKKNSGYVICIEANANTEQYHQFQTNIRNFGVDSHIIFINQYSEVVYPFLSIEADMLFIDAGHNYEETCLEIREYSKFIKDNGIIAFHDYEHPWTPKVTQSIDNLVLSQYPELYEGGQVNKLLWLRKPKDFVFAYNTKGRRSIMGESLKDFLIKTYDIETIETYMKYYGLSGVSDWNPWYVQLYNWIIDFCVPNTYIIELGCWEAGSTLTMAYAVQHKGLDVPVISIDIRGRVEMQAEQFLKSDTFNRLIATFIAERNIAISGIGSSIISITASTRKAIDFLRDKQVSVLLVDADHDYESVKHDIETYGSLLIPGGLIICHDYSPLGDQEDGCSRAINEMVRDSDKYMNFNIGGITATATKC